MAWFRMMKRFFSSEQRPPGDKEKRRRWCLHILKMKRLAPMSEPSSPRKLIMVQGQGVKEQNQGALLDESAPQSNEASQESAAIRIQSVFRGYLAREALRALKGVVKIQALIRGWAVRQQTINTLKSLQSIVNLQLEVCARRSQRINENLQRNCQDFGEKDINVSRKYTPPTQRRSGHRYLNVGNLQIDLKSQKNRDEFSKEELKAVQKERILREYYTSHRRSAETERDKLYVKQRYWLEQWVDSQLAKSAAQSLWISERATPGARATSLRHTQRSSHHHRKQRSTGDDNSLVGSPSLPAYMASTESAMAKTRSTSTPRRRRLSFDLCSEMNPGYMYGKLSPSSSMNSEHTAGSLKSPGLKGLLNNAIIASSKCS